VETVDLDHLDGGHGNTGSDRSAIAGAGMAERLSAAPPVLALLDDIAERQSS
jgi:hypothetical protein